MKTYIVHGSVGVVNVTRRITAPNAAAAAEHLLRRNPELEQVHAKEEGTGCMTCAAWDAWMRLTPCIDHQLEATR